MSRPESSVLELKDINKRTPLSRAAETGDVNAINKLSDRGADINAVDLTGKAPLFWAAIGGQVKSIRALIARGADLNIRDTAGRCPLSYAAELGHNDACWEWLSAQLGKPEPQARPHDELDADVAHDDDSSVCSEGSTESILLPLTYAVSQQHEASVKTLLEYGMSMYYTYAWGEDQQAIPLAAKRGDANILRLLLDAKIPYYEDMYGRTALMFAATRGHDSVVRILLALPETEPNARDEDGNTALMLARENGRESTVQILLQAGAKEDEFTRDSTLEPSSPPEDSLAPPGIIVNMNCTVGSEADKTSLTQQESLFELVRNGRNDVIQRQLEAFPTLVNAKDLEGDSLLSCAVICDNKDLVRSLLVYNQLDVNAQNRDGCTALTSAIKQRNLVIARLLARHKSIDSTLKDKNGMSPLLWSVQWRQSPVTRMLLGRCPSHVHHTDNSGRSLLHHAILASDDDILHYLIQMGVPGDSSDEYGRTPLSYAAERGQISNVEVLIRHANVNINSTDNCNRTALSYAAERGQDVVIGLLLKTPGVNAVIASRDGRTPLSYTCAHPLLPTFEMIYFFDTTAAKIVDAQGRSPLSWAAGHGSVPVCSFLIGLGVDINDPDQDGRDPLSHAAEKAQQDIVRLLLQTSCAMPSSRDKSGRTPLDWTLSHFNYDTKCFHDSSEYNREYLTVIWILVTGDLNGVPSVTSFDELVQYAIDQGNRLWLSMIVQLPLLNSIEYPADLVKYTIDRGSDEMVGILLAGLNKMGYDTSNIPILSYAAAAGKITLVERFLQQGIEAKGFEGFLPFGHAVLNGRLDVVKEFITNDKTDINAADKDGRTPLIVASLYDQVEALNCLLQATGVDVNHRDQEGRTAISHAAGAGHTDILKLLLADARVDAELKDYQGRSPLWYAVAGWREKTISYLLSR
jgi:ankyrin repeat protein